LASFVFSTISSPQKAGTAFSITITAEDAYGNPVISYAGSTSLTETGGGAGGTVNPSSVTFSNGVYTGNVYVTKSGTSVTITATYNTVSTASGTFNVNPGSASKLVFSGVPSSLTAGSVSGAITVQLEDQYGNLVNAGSGGVTVTLSPSGDWYSNSAGTTQITSNQVTISSGSSSSSSFYFKTTVAGSYTLTGSSTGLTSASASLTVNAGPLSKFAVTVPTSVTAGQYFSLTVTAQDAYGNTVTNYSSSVGLSVSGTGSSMYPTSTGTSGWSSGVWSSSSVAVFAAVGSGYTITANDGSGHTGTSNTFAVTAGTFRVDSSGENSATNANTLTVSSLNCAPDDLVIVLISSYSSNTISNITGGGLTWNLRTSISQSSHDRIWEYYAVTTSTLTSVTVNFGSSSTIEVIVFSISGANTANPFDGSARTAYATSTSNPSVSGVSTSNANDMIIGLVGTRSNTNPTAGSIAGTTGTLIQAQNAGSSGTYSSTAAEDRVVTSTLSSQSVAFSGPSTSDWAMIVEAVQRAW
jgi:hypothetical protein